MRVKIVQNTFTIDLGYLPVGKELDIEDSVAVRWVYNRIAVAVTDEPVKPVVEPKVIITEPEMQEIQAVKVDKVSLINLKKADLVELAELAGIEDIENKTKAELIALLEEDK